MAKTEKPEKYTFNTKLYICCGTDPIKPAFQAVYFHDGFAYATDGYVCIKQTLSLHGIINPEMLEGKKIHKDDYKSIMGFEIAECQDGGIECSNTNGQRVFFEYYQLPESNPGPDFDRFLKSRKGQVSIDFIGIDPALFDRVASALYCPGNNYRLQFTGIDTHIIIDAVGVDDQVATMMPKILEGTLF